MTVMPAKTEIARDRFGRPMVTPPDGGKAVAYTRCTTYVDCIEDKFNLQKWQQRMVALGLATRPDLMLSIAAHREDKRQLDKICEEAREAAAASAAATTGTALHALTELVDRGQELPALPEGAKASLAAYAAATADLQAVHIEQFCVLDRLQIGGTPDRVVTYQGKRYIADIKTGSIDFGILKIAAQLAVYSRSHTYDIDTAARSTHGADAERGIIIHLPAVSDPAEARCTLHWVDLTAGWQAVQVAKQVREQRRLKFSDLAADLSVLEPFKRTPPPKEEPKPSVTPKQAITDAMTGAAVRDRATTLAEQVRAAASREALLALWADHEGDWSEDLTRLAHERIAQLQVAS